MARICVITTPSSTSTGTCPRGLIARNSSSRFSCLCSFTSTASKGAPLVSSSACGTNEQAPGPKYSFRDMASLLQWHDSAAGLQRLAVQRRLQVVDPGPQRFVDGGELQR